MPTWIEIPDEFFMTGFVGVPHPTESPTDSFAPVHHMLRGKLFSERQAVMLEQDKRPKKILIFTRWFNKSKPENEFLISILDYLSSKDFKMLVLSKAGLVDYIESCRMQFNNIPAKTPEEVIELACETFALSSDQFLLVDESTVARLFAGFLGNRDEKDVDFSLRVAEEEAPKWLGNKIAQKSRELERLKLFTRCTEAVLREMSETYFSKPLPRLVSAVVSFSYSSSMELGDAGFTYSIADLDCKPALEALLSSASSIRELSVECATIRVFERIESLHLASIEIFSLERVSIERATLRALLERMTSLSVLRLSNVVFLDTAGDSQIETECKAFSLDALRWIDSTGTIVPNFVFEAASNLKVLIASKFVLRECLDSRFDFLSKLAVLHMHVTSEEEFEKLSEKQPSNAFKGLRALELHADCDLDFSVVPRYFPTIESLKLIPDGSSGIRSLLECLESSSIRLLDFSSRNGLPDYAFPPDNHFDGNWFLTYGAALESLQSFSMGAFTLEENVAELFRAFCSGFSNRLKLYKPSKGGFDPSTSAQHSSRAAPVPERAVFYDSSGEYVDIAFVRGVVMDDLRLFENLDRPYEEVVGLFRPFRFKDSDESLVDAKDEALYDCEMVQGDIFSRWQKGHYGPADKFLLARIELLLSSRDWTPLPSCSSHSLLKALCIKNTSGDFLSFQAVRVRFCKETSQYFAKLQFSPSVHEDSLSVSCEYLVSNTQPLNYSKREWRDLELDGVIAYLSSFSEGRLAIPEGSSLEVYLEALDGVRLGSCRHRALLLNRCLELYASRFGIKRFRYVVNVSETHDWIEVLVGDTWYYIDVGGFPLNRQLLHNPELLKRFLTRDSASSVEVASVVHSSLELEQERATLSKDNPFLPEEEMTSQSFDRPDYFIDTVLSSGFRGLFVPCRHEQVAYVETGFKRLLGNENVFFIEKADELSTALSYLVLGADYRGVIKKGPGGQLHEFLSQESPARRVLLLNLHGFDEQQLVAWNSVFDERPQTDETVFADGIQVVGLCNPRALGGELTSRVACKPEQYRFPFDAGCLEATYKHKVFESNFHESKPMEMEDERVIDLYRLDSWEALFWGDFEMDSAGLRLSPSEIANKPGSVIFMNAPLLDERFRRLVRSLERSKGQFVYQGRKFQMPSSFRYGRGYDWERLSQSLTVSDGELPLIYRLTLDTEGYLYKDYEYDSDERVVSTKPGWLEAHKNGHIVIEVRSSFTKDQYARLLKTAAQYGVTVSLRVWEDVLPSDLPDCISQHVGFMVLPLSAVKSADVDDERFRFFKTDSIPKTLHSLASQMESPLIVDVSEQSLSSLLGALVFPKGGDDLSVKQQRLVFEEKVSAIWEALCSGEDVLLKGALSIGLRERLESLSCGGLWRYGRWEAFSGRLRVLSEESGGLNHFKVQELESALLEDPSLEQKAAVEIGTQDEGFLQSRFNAVQHVLSFSPWVWIEGKTGSGKTSFFEFDYTVLGGGRVYQQSEIAAWAGDGAGGVLVIDEANLQGRSLLQFSDMANDPPSIYVDGVCYPLTNNHKVVFLSNPSDDSAERKEPEFSRLYVKENQRLNFGPIPGSHLRKRTVSPYLERLGLEALQAQEVSELFIRRYEEKLLEGKDGKKTLITPRDVTTWLDVFADHWQRRDASSSAAQLAQVSMQWWDLNSLASFPLPPTRVGSDFCYVESHAKSREVLSALLAARRVQRKRGELSDGEHLQGLGGVILEGPPGVGKSDFVRAYLKDRRVPKGEIVFIRPSLPTPEKEELLRRAYDQGQIVVIDELNAQESIEGLLNQLLSPRSEENKALPRPSKPGFMVIGTQNPASLSSRVVIGMQNPASLSGRVVMGEAFEGRRLLKLMAREYTENELVKIAQFKGLGREAASLLARQYRFVKDELKPEGLTVRQFVREAQSKAELQVEPVSRDGNLPAAAFLSTPQTTRHPPRVASPGNVRTTGSCLIM